MKEFIKFWFGIDSIFCWWGPGIHLFIAQKIIDNSCNMIKDLELIKKYKKYFLYGTIAPDITLGKKYIREAEKHCHGWNTAFLILKNASNEQEKAVAYGYLVHLASDVIAHNYYVPKELLVSFGFRGLSHTVSEIKADMILHKETRGIIEELLKVDFSEENKFISQNISKAILPFGVNRRIFEYSLKGSKSSYLKKAVTGRFSYEKWVIEKKELLEEYYEISYKLSLDILTNMENSKIIKYDPNGIENIELVKKSKKELRKIDIGVEQAIFYRIPDELKNI